MVHVSDSLHNHHGYYFQQSAGSLPPQFSNIAINPQMTMGDYSPIEMVIGSSFPPLSRREDMPLPMAMSMQSGPSRPTVIEPRPSKRRRIYTDSFGLEDEEEDKRGTPKVRRIK